jgi:hypothetical protein
MIGDVAELVEVTQRDAAAGLLLVQERLDRGERDQVLRARIVHD